MVFTPTGPKYFKCTYCGKDLACEFTEIKCHGLRKEHLANERIRASHKSVIITDQEKRLNSQVKVAEIRSALFLVEHNIALSDSDHLLGLMKVIYVQYHSKFVSVLLSNL